MNINMDRLEVKQFLKEQGITINNDLIQVDLIYYALKVYESVDSYSMRELYLKSLRMTMDTALDIMNIQPTVFTPKHYTGKEDVISFLGNRMSDEAFTASMVFNIVKYTTRVGRKDSVKSELTKIHHYVTRLEEHLYD